MNYRKTVDRYGNPCYRRQPGVQHRIIRAATVVTIVASVFIMLWGR